MSTNFTRRQTSKVMCNTIHGKSYLTQCGKKYKEYEDKKKLLEKVRIPLLHHPQLKKASIY